MDKVSFTNRIVIIGFGNTGVGLVPLLFRQFKKPIITVITADRQNEHIAEKYGLLLIIETVTKDNYIKLLTTNLHCGDILINLTSAVDRTDFIKWCENNSVLYIDAVDLNDQHQFVNLILERRSNND